MHCTSIWLSVPVYSVQLSPRLVPSGGLSAVIEDGDQRLVWWLAAATTTTMKIWEPPKPSSRVAADTKFRFHEGTVLSVVRDGGLVEKAKLPEAVVLAGSFPSCGAHTPMSPDMARPSSDTSAIVAPRVQP